MSEKWPGVAESTVGIAVALLGPMLVTYLQNLSAMSMGSVIVLLSDLNDEDRDGLFLRLFITSFSNFYVVLTKGHFLHLLVWSHNMYEILVFSKTRKIFCGRLSVNDFCPVCNVNLNRCLAKWMLLWVIKPFVVRINHVQLDQNE